MGQVREDFLPHVIHVASSFHVSALNPCDGVSDMVRAALGYRPS